MSKIEEEGFLSKESEKEKIYLVEKYQDFFEFARDLNKLCMKFLVKMKIDWENDHQLVTQAMYMRVVEGFQGIYLMLERGMMTEAKILTRSILEVTFILVALQLKPELLRSYLDKHEDAYLKVLKSALKFKNSSLKKFAKANSIERRYIEQKEKLKGSKLRILAPKNWAEEAELEDFYYLYYVTYSSSIHANLSALDDHVDKEEDIVNLRMGASDTDLYDVLRCAVFTLVRSTHSIGVISGRNMEEELDGFVNRLQGFDRKYIEATS